MVEPVLVLKEIREILTQELQRLQYQLICFWKLNFGFSHKDDVAALLDGLQESTQIKIANDFRRVFIS
jgi:hypothetical protein